MATAKKYLNYREAISQLTRTINLSIADNLRNLLESKHLYQSTTINYQQTADKILEQVLSDNDKFNFREFVREWQTDFVVSERTEYHRVQGAPQYELPTLLIQNVKLFCSNCGARETFSPTVYRDATQEVAEVRKTSPRTAVHPRGFQLFVLLFQCETCKAIPVGFLVKRSHWKLTLEGRSPIEDIEVPKFIPKAEVWLFRKAIIAAQTGDVLAGLFYLRSFIEQFARRQKQIYGRARGEEILEAYQRLLPEDRRGHMPSLRLWYDNLSIPMHAAQEDESVFNDGLEAVVEHFDFRRLYKISELHPPKGDRADAPPASN